ncbi:MAG: IS982 family transposase [Gammaproteobacteria bacterium]
MDNLILLFCLVDDFLKGFMPKWNQHLLDNGIKKRNKPCRLALSEVMTIFIYFHQLRFRDFKTYYLQYVKVHLAKLFPGLVSYNRFVELIKRVIVPLCVLIQSFSGQKTGIYFIDSLVIKACHIKREKQHKVFRGLAQKSKSSMGWFYGFKLHLVVNDKGEMMAFKLTAGNVDDRKPVPDLVKALVGKLFGDKGYLSQSLFEQLYQQGLQLVTRVRKGMKNKLMLLTDKILLRKRGIIESINDQLKNISQIEHTRHRSLFNFAANILAAIMAYILQPKKPSLNLDVSLVG